MAGGKKERTLSSDKALAGGYRGGRNVMGLGDFGGVVRRKLVTV